VPGVGYDLLEALSPDPDAKIGLEVRSTLGGGDAATPEAGFNVGDTIFLSTSPVLDHNGRAVPDGTPVDFSITYPGESLSSVLQSTTLDGIAQASIRLDRTGLLTIRATSDPARISDIVQLDVEQGVPAFATVIAPTPAPTATSSATDTVASPTLPAGPVGSSGGAAGTSLGVGQHTITCTAEDSSGNTSTCTFTGDLSCASLRPPADRSGGCTTGPPAVHPRARAPSPWADRRRVPPWRGPCASP